jgi:hypothetical protein
MALEGLRWNAQIVIDATNDFDPRDLDGTTSSEVVADLVGDAPVVKLSTGGGMQQVGGALAGANLIRLPDPD